MAHMAVKTQLSKGDFAKILTNYDLGEYKHTQPINEGTVQTNFLLQTIRGKAVFRYYENRSKDSVSFEVNLIKYLRSQNYPCPAPFKNNRGMYIDTYNKKPFVIFEFVEGYHIEDPNESQKMQLIRKVAELQNITKNYRPFKKSHRWN